MKNFKYTEMFSFKNNLAPFRVGAKRIIFKIFNVISALALTLLEGKTNYFLF